MRHPLPDPWAIPEPGFEKYAGPKPDGFEPLDQRGADLRAFLRSEEVQAIVGQQIRRLSGEPSGAVKLSDGTPAQITQKAEAWELMVHVRRDFYKVFSAPTRDEVLRMAEAACS